MAAADEGKIDPAVVAALFEAHSSELHRFAVGLLRDAQRASDVVQATFAKLVQLGHATQPDTRKAWLFRVAYHEAMLLKRKDAVDKRATEAIGWCLEVADSEDSPLIRDETIGKVRAALHELPREQQVVVGMRIYEGKTFVQIAETLNIPLGTAIARMHAALKKLRGKLSDL